MENEIKLEPKSNFYLATDDNEVKIKLKKHFGAKILTYDNSELTRSNEKGMKDAVVDLWCLSHTSKIIGSYTSSFSAMAAEIGKINLIILDKK
jgi:hypothetical protein